VCEPLAQSNENVYHAEVLKRSECHRKGRCSTASEAGPVPWTFSA
jgi:hypothetical protein